MKEQWEDLWMLALIAKFSVIQHFMVVKHWSAKVVHFTKMFECITWCLTGDLKAQCSLTFALIISWQE